MRDSEGNVVVYIGQPWVKPDGILVSSKDDKLTVKTPGGVLVVIENDYYKVSNMPYKEYMEWKKDFSGIPDEVKKLSEEPFDEPYDRFEIMEF